MVNCTLFVKTDTYRARIIILDLNKLRCTVTHLKKNGCLAVYKSQSRNSLVERQKIFLKIICELKKCGFYC